MTEGGMGYRVALMTEGGMGYRVALMTEGGMGYRVALMTEGGMGYRVALMTEATMLALLREEATIAATIVATIAATIAATTGMAGEVTGDVEIVVVVQKVVGGVGVTMAGLVVKEEAERGAAAAVIAVAIRQGGTAQRLHPLRQGGLRSSPHQGPVWW
jgi:hypothetical protein